MMNFDTIVVGAGQAGPFLAAKLVNRGRKVALVEARDLGGTCVNRGCTPTKTLRKSARVAYLARRAAEFGVQVGPVKVDFAVAMQRMQDRVDQARSGLESWLGGLEGLRIINRPLKKWASNASGTLFSKKRVAQTRLRSDCTGQSGLFAGHLAHFGRTYPRAHA